MYSNAGINPIIYAGFNDSFKKSFKDLINGITRRNSPSASESFETEYKQRSILRARNALNGSTVRTTIAPTENGLGNACTVQKPDIVLQTDENNTNSLIMSSKL